MINKICPDVELYVKKVDCFTSDDHETQSTWWQEVKGAISRLFVYIAVVLCWRSIDIN